MDIDHLHFYVGDNVTWQTRFLRNLGGRQVVTWVANGVQTTLLTLGQVPILLSTPLTERGAVADYLRNHPPGLADVAFRVKHLGQTLEQVVRQGGKLVGPPQTLAHPTGRIQWCPIQGWGSLRHTLLERQGPWFLLPWLSPEILPSPPGMAFAGSGLNSALNSAGWDSPDLDHPGLDRFGLDSIGLDTHFTGIDHVVLNVYQGELSEAIAWYEHVLGFRRQQQFWIQTAHSGLQSRVLVHPEGQAQLPINEPITTNSQVQEFLLHNRGAGIQHVALQTPAITQTVAYLRQRGQRFLTVPQTYYQDLMERSPASLPPEQLADWQTHHILVDWSPDLPQAYLLQTFTQPIFDLPTFFFEVIERQQVWQDNQLRQAQGFGEGNFKALFEAIEREQAKRGSLQPPDRLQPLPPS